MSSVTLEAFNITEDCRPCRPADYVEHSICKQTGYIETIYFSKTGYNYRSCPKIEELEAAAYWKFEAAMLVVSLIFSICVMFRQRTLDKINTERIQKQLSAL